MKLLSTSHFASWAELVPLLGMNATPIGKFELYEIAENVGHVKIEMDVIHTPLTAEEVERMEEDLPF